MSTQQRTHRTPHRLGIHALADLVFSMLRDASHWPYLEGLTVYSERVSCDHSVRSGSSAATGKSGTIRSPVRS